MTRTLATTQLIGLLLFACSTEHTIATETDTDQAMTVVTRPACVDLCNHALACGEVTDDTLTNCLLDCEQDCAILDTKEAATITPTNEVTSGPELITKTIDCFVQSACNENPSYCSLWYLDCAAGRCTSGQKPSNLGTRGLSSCGMQEDQLTCRAALAQGTNTDPNQYDWEMQCARASATATEWTCKCFEYGVEVAEKTGVPRDWGAGILEICWSKERLSCFYSNTTGC
jgi:hypothetical protein